MLSDIYSPHNFLYACLWSLEPRFKIHCLCDYSVIKKKCWQIFLANSYGEILAYYHVMEYCYCILEKDLVLPTSNKEFLIEFLFYMFMFYMYIYMLFIYLIDFLDNFKTLLIKKILANSNSFYTSLDRIFW